MRLLLVGGVGSVAPRSIYSSISNRTSAGVRLLTDLISSVFLGSIAEKLVSAPGYANLKGINCLLV